MQPLWVTLNPVLRFLAIFKYFANIKMRNDYIEVQLDTMLVEKNQSVNFSYSWEYKYTPFIYDPFENLENIFISALVCLFLSL